MSWGYHGYGGMGFADKFKQNKRLISVTKNGTKIYKYELNDGVLSIKGIWHDNRKTKFPSCFIIKDYYNKSKALFIPEELKTQKSIFNFLNENLDSVIDALN